jgi:hypothetical protein
MTLAIDIVVGIGALLAAAYCMVLSRRLRSLTRLDGDIGKAIAVLSAQVDELTRVLKSAERSSGQANDALQDQIAQAEGAARRLELLMAAAPASVRPTAPPREPEDPGFAPLTRADTRKAGSGRSRVVRQRDASGVAG